MSRKKILAHHWKIRLVEFSGTLWLCHDQDWAEDVRLAA